MSFRIKKNEFKEIALGCKRNSEPINKHPKYKHRESITSLSIFISQKGGQLANERDSPGAS